jgi:hypothetical protein
LWLGSAILIVVVRARRNVPGVGLLIAYVINLGLIHWIAASFYLLSSYKSRLHDPALIEAGMRESTIGIMAFAAGSLIGAPIVMGFRKVTDRRSFRFEPSPQLPRAYMLVGVIAFLLLTTWIGRLPTANALAATAEQLFLVGLCLMSWQAWRDRRKAKLAGWIVVTLLLPLTTVVFQGFISFGTAAAIVVLAFLAKFLRPRMLVVGLAFLLAYGGMSVYVSYARDRGDIRAVVWTGAPLAQRASALYATFRNFEWLDLGNQDQLALLDQRLNQDSLVGAAVRNLQVSGSYANGRTIVESVGALVPRAVWHSKPAEAGSGKLVSEFTGITFAEGTSVGIGQVMEFYVNFGTVGVIVGFFIIGLLLTLIDITAARRLFYEDWQRFAVWFLVGVSFLLVGGSLVELTTSAGAGVVTALLLNRFVLGRLQRRTHRRVFQRRQRVVYSSSVDS